MKKFILGLFCGAVLAASTTIYASDEIRAQLFPVKFEFNGKSQEIGSRFSVLNYEGHTYVPLRYIAENLGAGAAYNEDSRTVSVVSEPVGEGEAARKLWAAKFRLERGMTSREVKDALGEPSFLTLIDSSQQQLWRYDIGVQTGYPGGGTTADSDSIGKGLLEAQLFISWSAAGTVNRYELWYGGEAAGGAREVHSYIVYPDGSTEGKLPL